VSTLKIGDLVEVKAFRGRVFDVDDGGRICIKVRKDTFAWVREEMVKKVDEYPPPMPTKEEADDLAEDEL